MSGAPVVCFSDAPRNCWNAACNLQRIACRQSGVSTMKKLLLTMTALAGLAAAAPAPAQYLSTNTQVWSGVDIHYRIDELDNRLDDGIQSGANYKIDDT